MITTRIPQNWQDLQSAVAAILEESGFSVETEVRRETVRGAVEFDVYGSESVKGRTYSVACECKHWKSRVPQTVIHSFRTVVADIGANLGYIISRAGFQEGAYRAAELTNIRLLSWEEFQGEFEESWYTNFFSPRIAAELDPLLSYTEPLLPAWFGDLTEEKKQQYYELKENYDEFGWAIMSFTPYVRMLHNPPIPKLPLIARIPPGSSMRAHVPDALLTATGYRDFLEEAVGFGKEIIEQFRAIRATVVPDDPLVPGPDRHE